MSRHNYFNFYLPMVDFIYNSPKKSAYNNLIRETKVAKKKSLNTHLRIETLNM